MRRLGGEASQDHGTHLSIRKSQQTRKKLCPTRARGTFRRWLAPNTLLKVSSVRYTQAQAM